jgi:hypothetical protein
MLKQKQNRAVGLRLYPYTLKKGVFSETNQNLFLKVNKRFTGLMKPAKVSRKKASYFRRLETFFLPMRNFLMVSG